MNTLDRRPLHRPSGDHGIAMVIAITMMAMVTGMGVTVFVLASNNLMNARADRASTTSLANAEAGIGQAIAYLKSTPQGKIACAPTCGAANPWGEEPAEAELARGVADDGFPSTVVSLAGGETYKVWFQTIQLPSVVSRTPGVYTIHSIGDSTGGKRKVQVQIEVAPFNFPLAVFADAVQAGGNGTIQTESLLSTGCITRRSKIKFVGVDPIYNIPAAAHSSQYISVKDTGGSGTCPANDPDNIHSASICNGSVTSTDVDKYPFDQDRGGGDLAGPAGANCYKKGAVRYPASDPDYPLTSKIVSATDLASRYKFRLEGLSDEQLALLRTSAMEQGFYFTDRVTIPDAIKNATTGSITNPVLFYDLKDGAVGGTVDMKDISTYYSGGHTAGQTINELSASSPACTGRNFVLIVRNGNVKMNSNTVLSGSVFALGPAHGNVDKANGTASIIGTLYSRSLDLTGTANVGLTECFLANLPPGLSDITIKKFNEMDR